MTPRQLRTLAKRIARALFTNGSGERAQRLVLEMKDGYQLIASSAAGRRGGSWSERAARVLAGAVATGKIRR